MKNIFLKSYNLKRQFRFALTMCIGLLTSFLSYSQTNFYNGGTDVTVYPNTILFVDGHVSNNIQGFFHNQGDIYLTGDWTNKEPSGCLDPTNGTVILYGTTQTIQGTQTTTFNNLDCQGIGTKTLNINTIVGGNTGALSLHSDPFDLNSKTLIITNPASTAITRSSGYIISETDPTVGYGKIQWDLGNTSGNYIYPFGTFSGTYIPFLYNVTSAGTPITMGDITVATYPTSVTASPNNRPLPTGVSDLTGASGNESAAICADRFWTVDAADYSSNPTADYTFTYRDEEWDASISGSTNNIVEDSLHAWMWNGTQWQNPSLGTCDASTNTVSVTGINISAPWTLKAAEPLPKECGNYEVPNAFSPNGDGHSDLFVLHGWGNCVSSFSFLIFDRWGEKVFETEDASEGWDGNYKGKPLNPGVFVYYIRANSFTGEKITKKGNISLIR